MPRKTSPTFAEIVSASVKKFAQRVPAVPAQDEQELKQEIVRRLWDTDDYPPEVIQWIEEHSRKAAQTLTKRSQRYASRHPPLGEMQNLAPNARSPDPVEEASFNERLSVLREIPEDEFEKSVLEWYLGELSGISNGSELAVNIGRYSLGHSYKRLKRFSEKVNAAVSSGDGLEGEDYE